MFREWAAKFDWDLFGGYFVGLVWVALSGPWVAAHYHLVKWAQRREKHKEFESLETVPEMSLESRKTIEATWMERGEDLTPGVAVAKRERVVELNRSQKNPSCQQLENLSDCATSRPRRTGRRFRQIERDEKHTGERSLCHSRSRHSGWLSIQRKRI